MSVKGKLKKCNKRIEDLEKEISKLRENVHIKTAENSSREQLYENIIKFAITNHLGGLKGGIAVDEVSIYKMKDLYLDIDHSHVIPAYVMRVVPKYY